MDTGRAAGGPRALSSAGEDVVIPTADAALAHPRPWLDATPMEATRTDAGCAFTIRADDGLRDVVDGYAREKHGET